MLSLKREVMHTMTSGLNWSSIVGGPQARDDESLKVSDSTPIHIRGTLADDAFLSTFNQRSLFGLQKEEESKEGSFSPRIPLPTDSH
jgi:hypothetical protein